MKNLNMFIMIVACFLFTGCTAKEPRPLLTTPHLVVVFTHAGMPISEVMRVSLDGAILEKKQIKGQGIFEMDVDDEGNIVLPATHNDRLFTIKTDGTVVQEKTPPTPMYVRAKEGMRLIPYNLVFDQIQLEIVEDGKQSFVDIDATVFRATWDDENIYATGDKTNFSTGEDDAFLYVISRDDKKIKEKVLLDDVLATFALEVIDQNVWIGSSYAETKGKHVVVFDPKTKSQTYVSLVDQNHPVPLRQTIAIFAVGDRIHVVDKHGFVTVLDRQTWEVIAQKQVQSRILATTHDESRAYTLMQNPDERSEAIITTYHLNDWSVVGQWRLTGNGKTLPQNLMFVQPAGAAAVSENKTR